jgi:hypothetical protein
MLAKHDIGNVILQLYFTYLTVYCIFLTILHKTKYVGGFPLFFIFFHVFLRQSFLLNISAHQHHVGTQMRLSGIHSDKYH